MSKHTYEFIQTYNRGYYNGNPMRGVAFFQQDQARKDVQREADLRAALRADGFSDPEAAIALAEQRARDWELAADEGRGPSPMVRGYALTLTFLLRLSTGRDTMDEVRP